MRRFAFVLALLMLSQPAWAAWQRAETPHFILYSEASETELREEARKLERFDQIMRELTGIGAAGSGQIKLTVYYLRGASQVQAVYGAKSRSVAGFYRQSPAGSLMVVPRELYANESIKKYTDIEDVILFHEYAHHLMLQYFPASYPAWYIEGFAEYVGNSSVEKDGSVRLGLPNLARAYSLLRMPKIPLERLLSVRVTDLKQDEISTFYARAWLLTHFLTNAPDRTGQLGAYLDALSDGTTSVAAARKVFGDFKLLDREVEKYLMASNMTYRKLSITAAAATDIKVTTLEAAQSASLPLKLRLSRGTSKAEQEPIAADLRKLVARYPNSAPVLTLLAEAELGAGNHASSIAAADAALKLDPTIGRALLWRGLALARPLREAKDRNPVKWREARSWIIKANRADPEDPLPLIENFRTLLDSGRPPNDIAIDGLGKALALVPQSRDTRFNYARALAGQRKFAQAKVVLEPVAGDPHGGEASAAARRLIGEMDNRIAGAKADLPVIPLPTLQTGNPGGR